MSSYVHVIRQGFNFKGLCDRGQFWAFMAVHCLISLLLLMLELKTPIRAWLEIAYRLFICIPFMAAVVRRLRDTGWALHWLFIVLVPLGMVFLVALLTLPSGEGSVEEADHVA
ncbi:hypothetical protein BGP77_05905 [Saccharospirillum sp. MSK14-1]|uniref:DUF805 domain-containing protein n=1 Tax=Saccharospirillum sp. MSK14-1 TaxID=1897632 RepID=UPI000D4C8362|nr:DUF805 domain-containing protein [Saccharospirillum sp. MSK14-1]PTY36818.1 hypothetical protein BGP77_05905 [Saccharospirillum sp. MSK14-1]